MALQVTVLAGWWALGRLTETPADRAMRRQFDSLSAHADRVHRAAAAQEDSIRRGLRPPLPTLTAAQRAQLAQLLRDSLGITWETRDSTTVIHLPPALGEPVGRAATQLGEGLRWAFLMAAALFLPIPTGLMLLTLVWGVQRRPWRRTASASTAAV